jgi:phosphatidate phosphatase LPIN
MNLKKGPNKISFAVSSVLQGRKVLNATIYLWDPDTKIVVSDIDGTITKYIHFSS